MLLLFLSMFLYLLQAGYSFSMVFAMLSNITEKNAHTFEQQKYNDLWLLNHVSLEFSGMPFGRMMDPRLNFQRSLIHLWLRAPDAGG